MTQGPGHRAAPPPRPAARPIVVPLLLLGALALVVSLLVPDVGFAEDRGYWIRWSQATLQGGLQAIYRLDEVNYNPLYLYLLAAFARLQGSPEAIAANINQLKLATLGFECLAVVAVMVFFQRHRIAPWRALVIFCNLAYLYNTLIWGQIDGIHTTFVLLALLAAFAGNGALSLCLFVLALNTKLQAIIFLPPVLLALLPLWRGRPLPLLRACGAAALLQTLLVLPFVLDGTAGRIVAINLASVDFWPAVSMNAFNLWYLLLQGNLAATSDSQQAWGLSYKQWGTLAFLALSALVLLPLLLRAIVRYRERSRYNRDEEALFMLACALLSTVFFYVNTQMHERYVHPAIIFSGVYAIMARNYFLYGLLSLAYLLNLEKVLRFFDLAVYNTLLFDERFISLLFLSALCLGLYALYRTGFVRQWWLRRT